MARHVEDIKNLIFDEPDFESDDEEEELKSTKKLKKQKKSTVETIVFRDPAKRKKKTGNVSIKENFCKLIIFDLYRKLKDQLQTLNRKNLILKKLVLMYINLV